LSGAVLDPAGVAVSTAPQVQRAPSVAFDGTNHLVVWEDERSGLGSDDIYAARVAPATGAPVGALDAAGIAVSTAPQIQQNPAVGFDGTNYVIAWLDSRNSSWQAYGARVTPGGGVLDAQGVALSAPTGYAARPALAHGGGEWLVSWTGG